MRHLVWVLFAVSATASSTTLREAASKHNLFIGAATNAGYLRNASEPQYKSIEQAQFSITTAENSCKVGPIHPAPDRYDFSGCDAVFDAATSAGQKVRGHNLCWHTQNPGWLNSSLSHDALVSALENHINTVVGHYADRAYAWDVVNEAVSDGPLAWEPTIKTAYPPWMPTVPDFIDRAFIAARAANSSAKLCYNDYGAEVKNAKSDRMYSLITGMQQRGVPIDCVGFQTHTDLSMLNRVASMEANLKRFASLGLEVHITELDVRACDAGSTCDSTALHKQAEVYEALLRMCLGIPQCKVFEMWGFTDRHTWITHQDNPTHKDEMPLPFDGEYKAKPAFFSMLNALTAAPSPSPPSSPKPQHSYQTQTTTCKNASPLSGLIKVTSVAACVAQCDMQPLCVAVDTDGASCYTKSACGGTVGNCQGWCSYMKVK